MCKLVMSMHNRGNMYVKMLQNYDKIWGYQDLQCYHGICNLDQRKKTSGM